MRSLFAARERPFIGGHRGTARYCPGNTIPAFERALASGADYIELDIRLSRDHIPVVIHDDTIDATTDGSGKVRDYTAEELKAFDAGGYFSAEYAGARIPTLKEALLWARGRTWLSIELKTDGDCCGFVETLAVRSIEELQMTDRIQLMTYDGCISERIKRLNSGITTCLMADGAGDPVGLAIRAKAEILNLPWRSISRELVGEAHRNGLLIHAGLINDPDVWREVRRLDVDMVDTDIPDALKAIATGR